MQKVDPCEEKQKRGEKEEECSCFYIFIHVILKRKEEYKCFNSLYKPFNRSLIPYEHFAILITIFPTTRLHFVRIIALLLCVVHTLSHKPNKNNTSDAVRDRKSVV